MTAPPCADKAGSPSLASPLTGYSLFAYRYSAAAKGGYTRKLSEVFTPYDSTSNVEKTGRNGRSHFRRVQQDAARAGLGFFKSRSGPAGQSSTSCRRGTSPYMACGRVIGELVFRPFLPKQKGTPAGGVRKLRSIKLTSAKYLDHRWRKRKLKNG